jgi:hypothetical protein
MKRINSVKYLAGVVNSGIEPFWVPTQLLSNENPGGDLGNHTEKTFV